MRGAALVLLVLTGSCVCLAPSLSRGDSARDARCFHELAAFAAQRDIAFDAEQVAVAERWAGAGHEIKRLPGLRLRLPVAHCGGTLAVDFTEDCRLVRSRGEGGCRAAYPVTFYR